MEGIVRILSLSYNQYIFVPYIACIGILKQKRKDAVSRILKEKMPYRVRASYPFPYPVS